MAPSFHVGVKQLSGYHVHDKAAASIDVPATQEEEEEEDDYTL